MMKYDNNFFDPFCPPEYQMYNDPPLNILDFTYPLDMSCAIYDDFALDFISYEMDKNSLRRSSFVFHPSFADAYWFLKEQGDTQRAIEYIECIMDCGVYGIEKKPKDDRLQLALWGKYPTIKKAKTKYLLEQLDREKKKGRICDGQVRYDMEKATKGFFCYEEYLRIAKEHLSSEKYLEYLYALTEIGCRNKYEGSDPDILLLINQVCMNMNATDLRYRRSISNGRKGGRKKLFSDEELVEAITKLGLATQKELAEHFGCSVRTIARRVEADNVKEYYDAREKGHMSRLP